MIHTMKTCRTCGEAKPLDRFHKDKSYKDGHKSQCRTCANAEQAARVTPKEVLGVARGQTWLYEGKALTVLGVTLSPLGTPTAVYRDGKKNRTLPIAWLTARGSLL